MQYHAIPCNTMQYHAITWNINNCWRSVPLPCGQYNGHFYHNSYLYLQAANTRFTFGLSAQIHLTFWRRGWNMVLCFYFTSVLAQILHLCAAEYLLLLHPEVFGAVNLGSIESVPSGVWFYPVFWIFFSENLHSVGTAGLPIYLLKFKTHMRTFCLSTSITIMIMKMKVVPEHILTSFTLLLW